MCKEQFVVGADKLLAVRRVCGKKNKKFKMENDEAILLGNQMASLVSGTTSGTRCDSTTSTTASFVIPTVG